MTNPVLNLNSPLVDKLGKVIPPWNSFFQQFTEKAPAVINVTVGASPFSYTPNKRCNILISDGTVSAIELIRGTVVMPLSTVRPLMVPIGIADTLRVTYSVLPTIQVLG